MSSYPYAIVNAFTRSSLGGNPAVIVCLPPGSLMPPPYSLSIIDTPTMVAVSKSFSQPIAAFVAPSGTDDNLFDIRFFVNDVAPSVCGHGLLATTMAMYKGHLRGLASHASTTFCFRSVTGATVRSHVVPLPDEELYEIELPATPTEPLLGEHRERVHDAVARALHTDPASLNIRATERGTGELEQYLMIVLGDDQDIDGRDVDILALLDATPFQLISFSHPTPGKPHAFTSRVFAPAVGLPEDQVCGTAHTLMVPYYASLPCSAVKPGVQALVRQASQRGGDLWVTFDEERKMVVLRGNATLFAKGEVFI